MKIIRHIWWSIIWGDGTEFYSSIIDFIWELFPSIFDVENSVKDINIILISILIDIYCIYSGIIPEW
jgi:hypothetical protein